MRQNWIVPIPATSKLSASAVVFMAGGLIENKPIAAR